MITQNVNYSISERKKEFDAVDLSDDFVSVQVDFSGVENGEIVLKQSLDGVSYSPIRDEANKPIVERINDTGTTIINVIGLHATKVKVVLYSNSFAGSITNIFYEV